MRALLISFLATLSALVVVAAYALLPGEHAHRGIILAIVAAEGLASLAVGLVPWQRLFRSGSGERLLRLWSIVSVLLISASVAGTGGVDSPFYLLYGLCSVFFAAAYGLRMQATLASVAVSSYLVALAAGGWHVGANTLVLRIGVFVILTGLAAYLSRELNVQIAAHVAARRELEQLALHDALTGLANRVLFNDRVEHALELARRRGTRAAVLVVDLDGFKHVNDALGHESGDAVLQQVGPRLSEALRHQDTVARMGGDEFAVLLPEVSDLEGATHVASLIVDLLEQPFSLDSVSLRLEASVGVALFPEHGTDAHGLVRAADSAMYAAKDDRSGWAPYTQARDDASPRRLALLTELRRALDEHELVVHYQPKVAMDDRSLRGVEALVRWQHPTRGLVQPLQFVPLAEQTALIGPLTLEVLDIALAQARVWRQRRLLVPVAVNLSVRNLHNESFPDDVARLLARHGLPASALELEVTESAVMTQPKRAASVLRRLDDMGVRVVLDDFGTGYSSLAYLSSLPVKELKIDRSFVARMHDDRHGLVLVRSVLNIARNLGLTVVAEGVADEATWNQLSEDGCDVAQGFYLSRPVPPDELEEWLLRAPPMLAAAG